MGYREQLERKIENKMKELVALQDQMQQAENFISAWEEALRMLSRGAKEEGGSGPRPSSRAVPVLRSGTDLAKAREVILQKGTPLHANELVRAIGKEDTIKAKIALVGTISAYARKKKIFVRTSPNTFGLLELGHKSAEEAEKSA